MGLAMVADSPGLCTVPVFAVLSRLCADAVAMF
jgi:hypothetical protein